MTKNQIPRYFGPVVSLLFFLILIIILEFISAYIPTEKNELEKILLVLERTRCGTLLEAKIPLRYNF